MIFRSFQEVQKCNIEKKLVQRAERRPVSSNSNMMINHSYLLMNTLKQCLKLYQMQYQERKNYQLMCTANSLLSTVISMLNKAFYFSF